MLKAAIAIRVFVDFLLSEAQALSFPFVSRDSSDDCFIRKLLPSRLLGGPNEISRSDICTGGKKLREGKMNCVETYMGEPAPEQLSRRVRRFVRRKRYDRVPLESSYAGFAVRMPRKLKVANLDFQPVKKVSFKEDEPAPSWAWRRLRKGYVAGMAETSPTRDWSLVPVKPRSEAESVELFVPEPEIGFTLSVLEESYEEHLRSAFGGRYA